MSDADIEMMIHRIKPDRHRVASGSIPSWAPSRRTEQVRDP